MNIKSTTAALLILLVCQVAGNVFACDVPVFRYALERWPVTGYRAEVNIPESEYAKSSPLSTLLENSELGGAGSILTVDLNHNLNKPELTLFYEHQQGQEIPVWSGKLNESTVKKLMDSPVRQMIANSLLEGSSAVWILLESGDRAKDETAHQVLEKGIAEAQNSLTLPELLEHVDAPGAVELGISYKVINVSRDDPAEEVLVAMLETSEPDLYMYSDDPIAFPVFGRGRVPYALIGEGINHDNVFRACEFLVGPCACEMKEDNPGMDLLIVKDWDSSLGGSWVSAVEGGQLSGLGAIGANSFADGGMGKNSSTLKYGILLSILLIVAVVVSFSVFIVVKRRGRG